MLEGPNHTQTLRLWLSQWVTVGAPHHGHWVLTRVAQSCSCPSPKGDTRNCAAPRGWILLGAVLGMDLGELWVGFPCGMS